MDGWVNGWPDVKSLKSNKSWPIRDNSIMDIFLDILLKPPQPFIGLFFSTEDQVAVIIFVLWLGKITGLSLFIQRNTGNLGYTSLAFFTSQCRSDLFLTGPGSLVRLCLTRWDSSLSHNGAPPPGGSDQSPVPLFFLSSGAKVITVCPTAGLTSRHLGVLSPGYGVSHTIQSRKMLWQHK